MAVKLASLLAHWPHLENAQSRIYMYNYRHMRKCNGYHLHVSQRCMYIVFKFISLLANLKTGKRTRTSSKITDLTIL